MRKVVARKIAQYLCEYRNKIQLVLFIAYCLFIVYYTVLSRESSAEHQIELRFMWAYREMLTGHLEWKEDVGYNLKNILFFVPFGFLFPKKDSIPTWFKNRRWLLILCAGMLLSIFVELTQYIFCLGLCELDDVVCNGLGAVIGHGLFRCIMLFVMKYKDLKDKTSIKELDE